MKTIGILTSSRADYGIYLPLLEAIRKSKHFRLNIIAFGTHLSPYHDLTLNQIKKDGFHVEYTINSMLLHDDPNAISTAVGLTSIKFAEFWKNHHCNFDIVFCLGDRYEMFAAVYAGIPFGVRFAHIHGGETTLGAIDNIYRHAISLASSIHFTSTETYCNKVRELTGSEKVYLSGSLSLDNIDKIKLYSLSEFKDIWNIDLNIPSILITIHPETIDIKKNKRNLECCLDVFSEIQKTFSLIITMPNADIEGSLFRNEFSNLKSKYNSTIHLIENFGTRAYFTCMKHTKFLLGNSSSGIIEAASFNKYVINLGDRQKGRLHGNNVINIPFQKDLVLHQIEKIKQIGDYQGENIYYQGSAVKKMMEVLNEELGV